MAERLHITIGGVVQGVGFRPFVYGLAARLGLSGFVTNRAGDVVIEAQGDAPRLAELVVALRAQRPPGSRIDRLDTRAIAEIALGDEGGLVIAPSDASDRAAAAIAPDLATCDACVAEILDATARRHGYAFTSCAACGPRLTIVTAAPYDRARTTMAPFAMCDACRTEYTDIADRRFHAQPIACPACGPKLDTTVTELARAIAGGEIVALKGLGGYHLVCDATRDASVRELRRRKHRDEKPFAVMVVDVEAARAICHVDPTEAELLASSARPIVLLRRRSDRELAASLAPGLGDVGVMLPYSPLHHLLVRAVGGPLVMTSGNVTDEPIAYRDDDARARLGVIADRLVTHDREIHIRCEDSVARVVDGAPAILRRARGYAPAPIRLRTPLDRPTLALGGHLKAAFALGVGDVAFVSPHVGDLDHLAAYESFVAQIDHFAALHRIEPVRVVHDLHPDYATTRLAEQLAHDRGLERVAVQHHRAHFASALVDAELAGAAIGVCFDGAGLGDDGTIWGGEILVGDCASSRRVGHLRAVPQPGGDRAAIEPWRMAVAYLREAREPLHRLTTRLGPGVARVMALCATAPRTTSAGRLFDAIAGLLGICDRPSFEGQAAMQLEALARDCTDLGAYPIEIVRAPSGDHTVLDTLPTVHGVLHDLDRGVAPAVIARRFHTTLVELVTSACVQIARTSSLRDVMLTGGVFQNAILATELPCRLRAAGLVPHVHRRVPPNDGGLALGQLAIAASIMGVA